jgi:transposase
MKKWIIETLEFPSKYMLDFVKMIIEKYREIVYYFHHPISNGIA